ncbi:hypothetical protein BJV74DRAFT_150642 [Russula compacta]|nr:hypothetical protein BJV74DRAFT_150642 [Russula compacta]
MPTPASQPRCARAHSTHRHLHGYGNTYTVLWGSGRLLFQSPTTTPPSHLTQPTPFPSKRALGTHPLLDVPP